MIEKAKYAQALERANKLKKLVAQVEGAEQILAGFTAKEKYPVLEIRINGVDLCSDMQMTPREQYEFFGPILKAEIEKLKAQAAEAYTKV